MKFLVYLTMAVMMMFGTVSASAFEVMGPPKSLMNPPPHKYIGEIDLGPPTNLQAFCDTQVFYIQSFCEVDAGVIGNCEELWVCDYE